MKQSLPEYASAYGMELRVHWGHFEATAVGHSYSPYWATLSDPELKIWRCRDSRLLFIYKEGYRFALSPEGGEVWADWDADGDADAALCYLWGPIFRAALDLRGVPTLHASAVIIKGTAVLIMGVSGAGKSTTAAAFASLGYPVLTEDLAALTIADGGVLVQPGYPRIRLWSRSVELLFGAPDALPRVTRTWDKRYLDLVSAGFTFHDKPAPLGAVYLVSERSRSKPSIYRLSKRDALMALVANGYTCTTPTCAARRVSEFSALALLADKYPVSALHASANFEEIYETCRSVVSDVEQLFAGELLTGSSQVDCESLLTQ